MLSQLFSHSDILWKIIKQTGVGLQMHKFDLISLHRLEFKCISFLKNITNTDFSFLSSFLLFGIVYIRTYIKGIASLVCTTCLHYSSPLECV